MISIEGISGTEQKIVRSDNLKVGFYTARLVQDDVPRLFVKTQTRFYQVEDLTDFTGWGLINPRRCDVRIVVTEKDQV